MKILLGLFLVSAPAFGWGSYGHEQINAAAIDLMDEGNPLAACFKKNAKLVTRYAITPDYEWKKVGTMPDDPELKRKKLSNDHYEHPLHFFEVGAFVKDGALSQDAVAALPTGGYDEKDPTGAYRKVFPEYRKRRAANDPYVMSLDPDKKLADPKKPTAAEVTAHGTAPWRIQQLYREGVAALKEGDMEKALYYLGTMGHYVGDMSQPYHGTLKFNPGGIHSIFEEGILEVAAKPFAGSSADKVTKLWKSFEATSADVIARGKEARKDWGEINLSTVVGHSISLAASGDAYVDPLSKLFESIKEAHAPKPIPREPIRMAGLALRERGLFADDVSGGEPPPAIHENDDHDHDHDHDHDDHQPSKKPSKPSIPMAVVRDFQKAAFKDPVTGKDGSVMDAANRRMGDGAALLSRIWEAAYRDALAARPELKELGDCKEHAFDLGFAISNYPKPDYLPKVAPPANPALPVLPMPREVTH